MKSYRDELEIIKKRVIKCQDSFYLKKTHDELLGGLGETNIKQHQKQKLIENYELTSKQQRKLDYAKRATMHMENLSIDVMRNLEQNTQNMTGINTKVIDINHELEQSHGIMARIMKKENKNKFLISLFSLVIFIIFIFVIYFKFIK